MRRTITALIAFGTLALAGPASAQLVNGLSGPNYVHNAPIGTKAGGSASSLKAPGEAAAIAGAIRNEMDARNMRRTFAPMNRTVSVNMPAARNQAIGRNETSPARLRLEKSSD